MTEKLKKLRIGKQKYTFHQPIRRQYSDVIIKDINADTASVAFM